MQTCPQRAAAPGVTVLVGPAGSRPATARRRALLDADALRRRWRAAGVDARLAAVHAPDARAAGVRPDHCLPCTAVGRADPADGGGTPTDVCPDGGAAADAEHDGAAAWLAEVSHGTTVHALGWRAAVVAVAARDAGGGPVVVHVDQPPSWPTGGPARGSRSRGVSAPARHGVAARAVSSASAAAGWAAVARCDAVVVESLWARELAVASGVPRARVTVAHPGVDPDPRATPWRADPDRPRRVLSLGAPADLTALRCLARAALDVAGELWVGRVSGLDPRAAEALHAHLAADPVAGRLDRRLRVLVCPAAQHCHDADVVVDVSRLPGRGLGLLAGMAAARAVVGADVGGAAEVVAHRVTGLVVPAQRPAAVQAEVTRLLRDPFRLEAYGVAGLDRLDAAYHPQRYLDAVTALHRRLGADRQGAARAAASAATDRPAAGRGA